jgi:hypothetical protein
LAHEEHDRSGIEESACRVDGGFVVLCQSAILLDSSEESLDRPALRLNSEADLVGVLAHDLDRDDRNLDDLLTRISAVGEDALDEWKNAARGMQKWPAAVAILEARWVRLEYETAPIRVDQRQYDGLQEMLNWLKRDKTAFTLSSDLIKETTRFNNKIIASNNFIP